MFLASLALAAGPSFSEANPGSLEARIHLPQGWHFAVYATGLLAPRLMQLTPSGDLLVSVSRAGVIALVGADRNGDGKSDGITILAEGLDNPHGLLLEGDKLYVAERTQIDTYLVNDGALAERKIVATGLPAGNGHVTRTLARGPDGVLYVTAGSSCNVCIEKDPLRAAMMTVEKDGKISLYASGLRNTVGFDWQPRTGILYGVDNGRDYLGDDEPADELNRIERGKHYGWPYRYDDGKKDPDFGGRLPSGLKTESPAFSFGAHVAPLAIRFLRTTRDPRLSGAALVTKHGSWNRSRKVGYEISSLHWREDGTIEERPFMTGCLNAEQVYCRPVDVVEAPDGSLFISDDANGAIYRLTFQP